VKISLPPIPPTHSGQPAAAGQADPTPGPPDVQKLLEELWQISHYGWIGDGVIRRGLIISAEGIPVAALAQGLRILVERGWVEQRDSDTYPGKLEWRLTDSGRTHAKR
jgi:DNA-binding HxlR family transcriptional regulator